ncbi:MAG: LTA synthase family protein, partial [Clostridiaceae bacterium]
DVTPTLYKLVNGGFVFNNFYNPIWEVSTSDGEYAATLGMIPKSGVWSMKESSKNYLPFAMGNQFKNLGYSTRAYHNHTYNYYRRDLSHPNLGYDYKGVGNGLKIKETWPESDLEMMEVTVPEYINDEKFHAYYMTVSGHMNYTFMGNSMAYKNRKLVEDLPYSEEGKAYIAANIELDKALEYLINSLEKAGKADKTVIVLSADHYPYGLPKDKLDELAGHKVEENFELYKSNLIIWSPSIEEPIIVDKYCSSIDIIPTVSNLFGLEYDSRLLMGRDILSDSKPLVVFNNRSFITDEIMYNSKTGETISLKGTEVTEEYIGDINKVVNSMFIYSAKVLEKDYYKKVLN